MWSLFVLQYRHSKNVERLVCVRSCEDTHTHEMNQIRSPPERNPWFRRGSEQTQHTHSARQKVMAIPFGNT